MRGTDSLLHLKVAEQGGKQPITRDVIVLDTISFYNLHRCLQFCIKPRQGDSTVDGKEFTFRDASTNKPISAAKTAQLSRNKAHSAAEVGQRYVYEADKRKFTVEIVKMATGDGRYHVPRCIDGRDGTVKADLDPVNGKLLVRRFSKARAGQRKGLQAFWHVAGSISPSEGHEIYMRCMRKPIDRE